MHLGFYKVHVLNLFSPVAYKRYKAIFIFLKNDITLQSVYRLYENIMFEKYSNIKITRISRELNN